MTKYDSDLFKEALRSLAADSGLHPLVPYFSYFIADEVKFVDILFSCTLPYFPIVDFVKSQSQVTRSLNNLPVLFALMRVVRSLLQNPHIHIEPYVSFCFLLYFNEHI